MYDFNQVFFFWTFLLLERYKSCHTVTGELLRCMFEVFLRPKRFFHIKCCLNFSRFGSSMTVFMFGIGFCATKCVRRLSSGNANPPLLKQGN